MKHGLWAFHRIARVARKQLGKDWMIPEDRDRIVELMGWKSFILPTITKAEMIIRCARRYARRFGGVNRVGDWNSLCYLIAQRGGFTHHATLRSCLIEPARPKTLLAKGWQNSEHEIFSPRPRFYQHEVRDRLTRIADAAKKRKEREANGCRICGVPSPRRSIYYVPTNERETRYLGDEVRRRLFGVIEGTWTPPKYCFTHYMQICKLIKQAKQIDQQRLEIGRARRKLSESTKDAARA